MTIPVLEVGGERNGVKTDRAGCGDDEPASGGCAPLSDPPLQRTQLAIGKHAGVLFVHAREEFRCSSIRFHFKPRDDRRPGCFEPIFSSSPVSTRLRLHAMSWTDLAVLPRRGETVEQRFEVTVEYGNVRSLAVCQQCDVMLNCSNFAEQPERIECLLNESEPILDRFRDVCRSKQPWNTESRERDSSSRHGNPPVSSSPT